MERFLTRLPVKTQVKITGAGIKGLSLAYFLKQRGIKSVIFEKSDRPGGLIRTCRHEGFIFEAGPRTFRAPPVMLAMIRSLGLEKELHAPNVKKRYILHRKKLVSPARFFPRLALGLVRDLLLPPTREEMSVKAYFTHRLGGYCTDTLIDPLVSGIFGGDIAQLSARGALPTMTSQGSILRSLWHHPKWPIYEFKQGMQTLIEALAAGQEIHYGQTTEEADFDCTPSPQATYVPLIALNLGWREDVLPCRGFGYLVPQKEREPILGVVFDHASAQETRLTVMMGGAHHPELIERSDNELLKLAQKALSDHLGIQRPPAATLIHRVPKAVPQPLLGHPVPSLGVAGAITEAYLLGLKV